jgi:hypothetical protein
MGGAEWLANPPVTLRRVMDHLRDDQDLDLLCDLESEFGLVDLMLEGQEVEYLRELAAYLGPLLASPSITEESLADLIVSCKGYVFEETARSSLEKLYTRTRDRIDASYRHANG